MLENLKVNECNIIELFPENQRDYSELIPQSVLPITQEEKDNAIEIESEMASDEGMDAIPEGIFNALIEYLLENSRTRDVLMFVIQANLGIRHSDLTQLKLIQFINTDGKFRDKVNWTEQKTSKTRSLYINDAIKAAMVIYLKDHSDKKLTDYLFTAEGKNKGYKKVTYIDNNGKKKVLRQNGKYVYERDENGNLIPEPMRRSQEEIILKDSLLAIGVSLKNDSRCINGQYKLNSHSLRKFYAEKFSETAYDMRHSGELKIDANVMALVQLDLMHTNMQTTMRYNRSFDRIKEMVCNRMNIGLRVLKKYISQI